MMRKWRQKTITRLRPAMLAGLALAAIGGLLIIHSFAATPANNDLNGDKKVTIADLSILLANFGKTTASGDLNGDGKVTISDLSILLAALGKTVADTPPATPQPAPNPTPQSNPGVTKQVNITFYGSYDNDPKGSLDIAHPVLHQKVGGVGSFDDPLTFASPAGNGAYAWGQKIYVPSVQKYFIREDECAVSWTAPDGCGPVTMVDLYIGNPSSDKAVVKCEESLTVDGTSTIITDPPSTLAYDSKPLWNQSAGTCSTLH